MGKTIAAGIFIVKKNGDLLVCHPTNHAANFWSIPKGKVEEGETMIEAAIRETYEETNINFNEISELHYNVTALDSVNYGHKKKMIYPFVYLEVLNSKLPWDTIEIKCNSNVPEERGGFPEMDDYKWVTIDEARMILHYTQVACLDKIAELVKDNRHIALYSTND